MMRLRFKLFGFGVGNNLGLLVGLIFIGYNSYSQNLREKLLGSWVCEKVVNSSGEETYGKFGPSGLYTKLNFSRTNLYIVHAPFDFGNSIPIGYGPNYIDLMPYSRNDFLTERKFDVKFLTDVSIILSSKDQSGELIEYYFSKEKFYYEDSDKPKLIDGGIVVIEHHKGSTKSADSYVYFIRNDTNYFRQLPMFRNSYGSFGSHVSINFSFPKDFKIDSLSKELIVDFSVTSSGIRDVEIIQSSDSRIDESIVRIIENSSNKWKAVVVNSQPKITRLRLHFFFYLGRLKEFNRNLFYIPNDLYYLQRR